MSIISRRKNSSHYKNRLITDSDLSFAVTESYKALRTNLVFALSTKKNKTFAITSSNAGEGKSSVSANLAITFAQADMHVLLIDCDMRKPVQHRNFSIDNKIGLSTLLGGLNSLSEVLVKNVMPNLDLITSGTIPPNPSEMLGSENMSVLLGELSSRYDYIILDTPPIGVVTDALTVSRNVAGVALVTRSEIATSEQIARSIEAIKLADADFLGFIVTDINSGASKGGSYKYGYSRYGYSRYGYGYSNNSDDEASEVDKTRAIIKNSK